MRCARAQLYIQCEGRSLENYIYFYFVLSTFGSHHLLVVGAKGKGRPKKTWNDCVIEDMKLAGLRREDAQDRVVWRSGILGKRQTRACVKKKTLKRL